MAGEMIKSESNKEFMEESKAHVKNLFDKTSEKIYSTVEDFVSSGYVRMLSLLVYYLPEERQNAVLEKLPEEIGNKIKENISSPLENHLSWDGEEVYDALKFVMDAYDVDEKKLAASVIDESDPIYSAVLISDEMEEFRGKNPFLADAVKKHVNVLDVVLLLHDLAIQKVLREIDSQTLAIALKGASEKVKEKFFNNMSRKAESMIREEMDFIGHVSRCDVVNNQRTIYSRIKRLEESGDIVIIPPEELV